MLNSELNAQFELIHLDTADRRGLSNVGLFDWDNIVLALKHGLKFLRLVIAKNPDIVYMPIAQNIPGYLRDGLFLVSSRVLHKRVVVHLHGSEFRDFYFRVSGWMKFLIRWTLEKVRRGIVLSPTMKSLLEDFLPSERIVVVPNGIEPMKTKSDKRKSEAFNILYLGTLMRSKGFQEVVYSAPYVVVKKPDVNFILAGEHCYPEELRAAHEFIVEHQLQQFISMPGVVFGEEKKKYLEEADIFVFPPIAPEGQPLVILEAMAAGLPVITTNQGAISETVIDGVNGFIVPPNNPQVIAEKIILLCNSNLRARMGQASRDRFIRHYTLDRWLGDMMQAFQEVLKGN